MTIAIEEIRRIYRYNGIELPAPPGMAPREVRDLHSAIFPELISAEIVVGDELVDGAQEITFRRAVGTKGAMNWQRFNELAAAMAEGRAEAGAAAINRALDKQALVHTALCWQRFTASCARHAQDARHTTQSVPSSWLPPLS